jgi:N6-adenosine-specific RNA methylase IME4
MAENKGHSKKPKEFYNLIENNSPGPYIELFAREKREGWESWGDQL